MSKPKKYKTDDFPPPIPELSGIVGKLERDYDQLREENMGSTSFDADARLATVKVLAIIADELSWIRRALESRPSSPAPESQ